jgi:tRNA 2-thiouridine synthesizing protein A
MAMVTLDRAALRPPPPTAREIDGRGHFHPGPLLDFVRAVHEVPRGQMVALVSDDAATLREVGSWLRREHHAFLGSFPENGATRVVVRRTH